MHDHVPPLMIRTAAILRLGSVLVTLLIAPTAFATEVDDPQAECNMVQDSDAYYWVFAHQEQQGTAHRSGKPNDIQSWLPPSADGQNLGVPLAVMASLVAHLPVEPEGPAALSSFLSNGVTAHRGNSSEFPENTIPAFQSGINVGADWLELDIFRTRDGKLVVIHDRTTSRVGDQDLAVAESSLLELANVDVAAAFRRRTGKTISECPPTRIPLLRDVLQLVIKQGRTRVSIQPKMDCVADAVALVRSMKAERWVGFNDGNLDYMADVKRLAPDIPVFWDRGSDTNVDEDIRIAKQHGFEALVLHHQGVTPGKIQKIKSAGMEVGAWTVNDRETMKRLLDAGVERLYTDHPRLLISMKSRSP